MSHGAECWGDSKAWSRGEWLWAGSGVVAAFRSCGQRSPHLGGNLNSSAHRAEGALRKVEWRQDRTGAPSPEEGGNGA